MEQENKPTGPMPWEEKREPLPLLDRAVNVLKGMAKGVMPWEQERPRIEPPKPVPGPKTYDFETVFSKLIQAESGGKHSAVSGKGARGVTQVMPKTGARPGFGVTPLQDGTEAEYKRFGRDYLQAMLREFNGDYEKALAAYNAGHGNVMGAVEKARQTGKDWKDHLPKRSETLPYLEKILNEGTGETKDSRRLERESALKQKLGEVISGREARTMLKDLRSQYNTAYSKLSPKQKDSFPYFEYWIQKEHPDALGKIVNAIQIEASPMTDRQRTAFGSETQLTVTETGAGVNGFIYEDNPDRVFLGRFSDANTMVHEAEHLRQHAYEERTKARSKQAAWWVDTPFTSYGTVGNSSRIDRQAIQWLNKNKDEASVKEALRAGNAFDNHHEFMANIAAYESSLPEGVSLRESRLAKTLEKQFGKEKTDEIISLFISQTLLGMNSAVESKFKADKKFKRDPRKSYASQLYDYLTQMVE